ncbi:uncharacterized protein LOC143243354 isoform X1 [Tachypleus tridentatus]|uniref:uncharacterized protein LOC143242788 isoform X1 n=1 Tax=Tachypleus tridentatus TaxID=6853 RepID=UPI003FD20394
MTFIISLNSLSVYKYHSFDYTTSLPLKKKSPPYERAHIGSSPAWQYAEQLHGPSTSFIPDIPPLPPFPLDDDGVTDDKALASMLMSWYMSGYHTSNYQALRQMRTESCECQEHGNKKCCLRCSS